MAATEVPMVVTVQMKIRGFTLIELMVTIAIIAILAGIAWPSYEDTVRRSKRQTGIQVMMLAQAHLEKCYSKVRDYTDTTCNLPAAISNPVAPNDKYAVANLAGDFVRTASTYSLTYTAQGDQVNDKNCRKFTITNTGKKTAVDSTAADSTATCWPTTN